MLKKLSQVVSKRDGWKVVSWSWKSRWKHRRRSDSEHEGSALDELQKTIDSVMAVPQVDRPTALDKELKLIEANQGKMGYYTEKLFQALFTIQSTSTSSERVFSVASSFLTKVRNQLKMETLDGLVFLKYYFINKK